MTDVSKTVAPKTDQLNFDDFIGDAKMTVKVTKVSLLAGEQPIAINYEGDNGKPFKPCKSMRRVLVQLWGGNGEDYIGRSMTLFGDPTVKFGGANVGGIRISHLSHISEPVTLALTASKAVRKPYVVRPLEAARDVPASTPAQHADDSASVEFISPDQAIELGDVLTGHADVRAEIMRTFGSLAKIPSGKYAKVLAKAQTMCGIVA